MHDFSGVLHIILSNFKNIEIALSDFDNKPDGSNIYSKIN